MADIQNPLVAVDIKFSASETLEDMHGGQNTAIQLQAKNILPRFADVLDIENLGIP